MNFLYKKNFVVWRKSVESCEDATPRTENPSIVVKMLQPGCRILATVADFLGKRRFRQKHVRKDYPATRQTKNGGILSWTCKLQPILQPGRRILDTLNGLSERNDVLPWENDNQGVESLVLSQISMQNHQFSYLFLGTRGGKSPTAVKMLHPGPRIRR